MDYVIYGIQNEFAYNVIKIVIFFFFLPYSWCKILPFLN